MYQGINFQAKLDEYHNKMNTPKECPLLLNPWVVTNIVYEVTVNHMITNDPGKMGFVFEQRYDPAAEKSGIEVAIAYDWKSRVASKRPAVFVSRGSAALNYPTIQQGIASNIKESEKDHLARYQMPVSLIVVAHGVGFVEQLAEYVRYPFSYFSQQIQQDFCLDRVRLVGISNPSLLQEAKDNFYIELRLDIAFSETYKIHADHLKLKTVIANVRSSCDPVTCSE